MNSVDIRRKFIQYFADRGHTHVPSAPVIPHDDPTLLFINAGMNQFKDVFLGASKRDYTKAVTTQKCIRVGGKHNDLDNVGHTSRHLTFFEMLGNFSFGDYFKKEAIRCAWEASTEVFGFDPERIWVSVFETDDEAYELWKDLIGEKRLIRLGADENFWAMGDVGPCGPCSELLYDRGPDFGNATSPLEDKTGERFPEFWNLVFMESNRDSGGHLKPLPQKNVDTGAGLERLIGFKMGAKSVFETDVLRTLISDVEKISGKKYTPENAPAFHVIADHIRSLAFAIADGAQPSNVERGYVLRKILRRAVRYGKMLNLEKPFLAKLLPTLTSLMGEDFPELKKGSDRTGEILTLEEEGFIRTLRRGGGILNTVIESSKGQISGKDAFKLKDTYGFPIEEIMLIAKDHNLEVNLDAYTLLEEEAKERSRSGSKVAAKEAGKNLFANVKETSTYVGYTETEIKAKVTALIVDGTFVDDMKEGQSGQIILDKTPFYAEKGGQIGDIGTIDDFEVSDCQTPYPDVIVHTGVLKKGILKKGMDVTAKIDTERRSRIAAHHTATHLLHYALEKTLGEHVQQAGSLVAADYLRFDFNHHKQLTLEEVRDVEELINSVLRQNRHVKTYELSFAEAQKKSSIKQIFGEKYGDRVRVVDVEGISEELCGGTHVNELGTIGYFRILKESSVGAGLRRIEAACGPLAEKHAYDVEDLLLLVSDLAGSSPAKLKERIAALLEENRKNKQQLKTLRGAQIKEMAKELLGKVETVGATSLIAAEVDVEGEEFAALGNDIAGAMTSGVVALGLKKADRCQLLIKVSEDLVKKGIHANALIKEVGPLIKGGGGGKKDAAQAGGKNPAGLSDAFDKLRSLLS